MENKTNICPHCGTDLEVEKEVFSLDKLFTEHSCHKKKHNMAGCFQNGIDPKRSVEVGMANLSKANYRGHPFWGNQHTLKI